MHDPELTYSGSLSGKPLACHQAPWRICGVAKKEGFHQEDLQCRFHFPCAQVCDVLH